MSDPSGRVPVLRISLTNATVLSVGYLLFAAGVEVVRRELNPHWAERLSLSMEAFPARLLNVFGVFEPLRKAWLEGHVSEFQVRVIYGVTVVGLIFSMGFAVGLLMGLVARQVEARAAGKEPKP